jgi:hypothetical protein
MSVTSEKNRGFVSPETKDASEIEHLESTDMKPLERNLVYEEDEEPEFHAQTWIALAAMFFLNLVQVVALMGPPAGVRQTTRWIQQRHH